MDISLPGADRAQSAARACIRSLAADTVREQLALVRIPAPSFDETARAAHLAARLRAWGVPDAERDEVGNVVARVPGGEEGAPPVLVAAHLDTVFPAGTDLTVRRAAGRIYAPGITDNARGLAALLVLGGTLARMGLRTRRPIVLVATVGEEGIGDLRGAKHLVRDGSPFLGAAAMIALDGSGVRRIVHRGIGSRRLRVTVRGPGGHSWSDWGSANPAHAVGLAIARLRELPVPAHPLATLTVARLGGGTSVNSIPVEAWMEIDLRSEEAGVLAAIEERCRGAIDRAVEAENAARRPGTPPLATRVEVIGDRPAGSVAADHPLVRFAVAATRAVGARPELVASSTDANAAIARGIPAVTIGAGGDSGGVHTPDEWYDDRTGAAGLERALLLVLAAAEVR